MRGSSRNPFNGVAEGTQTMPDYGRPVSVRFTERERAELERMAGDLTLSAYIRSQCIGEEAEPRRTRGKRPIKNFEALGRVLGALGRSQLSNNLNQLAKAANSGTIGLPHETQGAIEDAAEDIAFIRNELVQALGLKDSPP
ncbi:MAG: hypothetical protein AAGI28_04565 [Pseudomonadota bacterium]